jgi:biotin operon repressor
MLRAVDVARHLGISLAAVTANLQKLKSEERPL